jgi:hypothetical protein
MLVTQETNMTDTTLRHASLRQMLIERRCEMLARCVRPSSTGGMAAGVDHDIVE